MSLRLSLLTLLATLAFPVAVSNGRSLGCADVNVLATALKNITSSDWADISETHLQSMWPMELGGRDCKAGTCPQLRRNDRIINDECQCCEIFHFDLGRDKDVMTERLQGIVIYYATFRRNDTLAAAKTLAEALGLAPAEAAAIGRKPIKTYWRVSGEPHTVSLLEVHIMQRLGTWIVYLNVSRFPV